MRSTPIDPALVACTFVQDYNALWGRYFPGCMGRAHWQILQLIRTDEDGHQFSSVRGKVDEVHGIDEDTCAKRVKELVAKGWVSANEQPIRASTWLTATPLLVGTFDAHTVEAVNSLYAAARTLDPSVPQPTVSASQRLNKRLVRFFRDFFDVWNEHRTEFLKAAMPKPSATRIRALKELKRYAYWHIFLTAWMHAHPTTTPKLSYLLIEDFHAEIHKHFGVAQTATKRYVDDMIAWKLLERLRKEHGVPRGRFAVRIQPNAFETFRTAFASTSDLIVAAAKDFSRASAQDAPDNVAKLPRRISS
jgi:hypothetical protein